MTVVADTTPVNYLVLIGEIGVLPELFGHVIIPMAVFEELQNSTTPELVRHWILEHPSWLEVRTVHDRFDPTLVNLDRGEQQALVLAEETQADWILLDEIEARKAAKRRNLLYIGTLGILREGAMRQLLDLPGA